MTEVEAWLATYILLDVGSEAIHTGLAPAGSDIVFSTAKLVALTSVTVLDPEFATKNRVPFGNAVTDTGVVPTFGVPSGGIAGDFGLLGVPMSTFEASNTLTVLLPLLVT